MNTTPSTETALMPRQSLPAMAEAYRTAVGEMREAFAKLTESMQRLDVAFGAGDYRCRGFCLLLAELNLRGSQGAPQLPSGNRK